jgi:hypothetical protein
MRINLVDAPLNIGCAWVHCIVHSVQVNLTCEYFYCMLCRMLDFTKTKSWIQYIRIVVYPILKEGSMGAQSAPKASRRGLASSRRPAQEASVSKDCGFRIMSFLCGNKILCFVSKLFNTRNYLQPPEMSTIKFWGQRVAKPWICDLSFILEKSNK